MLVLSGWLRQNCMKVFHYVAEELKNESLFDNEMETSLQVGAVYNDFDTSPISSLLPYEETESFSFSQPSKSDPIAEEEISSLEGAVDNAVLEADRNSGLLYEHLQWDSPYFDNTSENCNEEYCKKVFNLATNHEGCWSSITISPEALKMFERRHRMQWGSSDSVYDAWLLRNGWQRPWFDMHLFSCLFPNYEEQLITDESDIEGEDKTLEGGDENQRNEDSESESTPVKQPRKKLRLTLPRIRYDTEDDSDVHVEGEDSETKTNFQVEDSKESIIKFKIVNSISDIIVISDDDDDDGSETEQK